MRPVSRPAPCVRHITIRKSERNPFDVNHLCPLMTHSPFSRLAVVLIACGSEPGASGSVIDYCDWQVPLGRRFRALKLWWVVRSYGAEGLRRHVREHVRLSQEFTWLVAADPRFELCAPPALNLTCFRHVQGNEVSERLLNELNATGKVFLSHTRLAGLYAIRCCIGGTWTAQRHVKMLWDLIDQLAPAP